MEIIPLLKQLGFSDKQIKIYLTLLRTGHASVRKVSEESGINRGTAYDLLKSLKEEGLVSYYHQATKQLFVAEDPLRLKNLLQEKIDSLKDIKTGLDKLIPELQSLYNQKGDKPVVKYYEGKQGVKTILADVLLSMQKNAEKNYYVFSSAAIRPFLYQALPDFTKQRVQNSIAVKVIAIGHEGTKAELSEHKSLTVKSSSPTYILIYSNKVAMISLNSFNEPLGLIVEDQALFATQRQLFEFIWQTL